MQNRPLQFMKLKKPYMFFICDASLWLSGVLFAAAHSSLCNVISGVSFSLALLLAYCGCIIYSLHKCNIGNFLTGQGKYLYPLLIVGMLFVFAEGTREHFVYFWDYGYYWTLCIQESTNLFLQPVQTLYGLFTSINNDAYNYLIPALMALPIHLIGASYVSYILLIFILFAFPMALVLPLVIHRLLEICGLPQLPLLGSILLILCVPNTLVPLLNGYCDISVLLLVGILWLLTFSFDWFAFHAKEAAVIAALLLLILFERRYFGFFVVGYAFGLCAFGIVKWIQDRKPIRYFLLNLVCIGGVCLAVLLLFFRDFLLRSLVNNYSVAYSAYSAGGIFADFLELQGYYGYVLILLALVGVVALLLLKRGRSYAAFFITSAFVTAYTFFRVQSMGMHQQYVVLTQGLILLAVGISAIYAAVRKKVWRKIVAAAAAAFLAVNFACSFSLIPDFTPDFQSQALSQMTYKPKVRTDIPQLQEMEQNLAAMAEQEKARVYVVSSSTIFNDDVLQELYLPDKLSAAPFVVPSSHVDLRDGFPEGFMVADIVVVADPPQYHLSPSDQQVVGILANEFLNNGRIGQHFSFVKNYHLDNGVTAKVYQKKTPITNDDILYLSQKFNAAYPKYPDLFKNRIEKYLTKSGT